MNKNELYRLLHEREKQFENAKLKRNIITILFFAVLYFLAFYLNEMPTGLAIVGTFFAALFIGGFHFWINAIVFSTLFRKGEDENAMLDDLSKQLSELEDTAH